MNVSPDFSPPIRVTAPYFATALACHLGAAAALFFLDPSAALQDPAILAWVHLQMVGFVMMSIFASMAQLVPVLGETRHARPWTLKAVWPLLIAGIALLVSGFLYDTGLLNWGGGFLVTAMALFTFNLQQTLHRSSRHSAVIRSMKIAAGFLMAGILSGLVLAAALSGRLSADLHAWLIAHVSAVFGGYVMVSVMGVSTVLLPMFGRARRLSENAFAASFYTMVVGVAAMIVVGFGGWSGTVYGAWTAILASAALYMALVVDFARTRRKAEYDPWALNTYAAYASLLLAWLCGVCYAVVPGETVLRLLFWFLMTGFAGFLIAGHLYRIVPFLVWFEHFAPLAGEREVPLLHEMVDARQGRIQFGLSLVGFIAATAGVAFQERIWLQLGAVAMAAGAAVLLLLIGAVLRRSPPGAD